MFQEIKNTIYKDEFVKKYPKKVDYGCRVVENNTPSLYKDEEDE